MSAGQSRQRRKDPAQEPRAPLFELQEKPPRKPPRPIESALDGFDELPDISPRADRRTPLRPHSPEPAPLPIAVKDPKPAPKRKPSAQERAEPPYREPKPAPEPERRPTAQGRAEPPYRERSDRYAAERRPVYEHYSDWDAPGALPRRPIWLLLVALVCGAIIWMYSADPKTIISGYKGLGSAAGQAASKAFALPDTALGQHSIMGQPTITAAMVDTILAQYGSPAAGTGQTWVALGQRYGIDPAYALAFFIHESSAGTNPGWAGLKKSGGSTHNIGNIICAGYATCYGRFRDYASWEEGIEDWYKLISVEYVKGRGAHTIEAIIPIYAPSSDNNNVPGYVGAVVSMVAQWRQGVMR